MNLKFHEKLILRTPLLPFGYFDLDNLDLKDLQESKVQESLYLSSRVFLRELNKVLNASNGGLVNQKVEFSLYKYLLRMTSRCTPFGLSSGSSVIEWNDYKDIVIDREVDKKCTLDSEFVLQVCKELSDLHTVRDNLVFYVNNTLDLIFDKYIYLSYTINKSQREYTLNKVEKDELIEFVISSALSGIKIRNLIDRISEVLDESYTNNEISAYVDDLINSQVLVSELEPYVCGPNDIPDQITNFLKETLSNDPTFDNEAKEKVKEVLKLRDICIALENNFGIDLHKQAATISERVLPSSKENVLQVDFFRDVNSASGINTSYKQKIIKTIEFFERLFPFSESDSMVRFRSAFYKKYEEREVPLMEVFNPETGINFVDKDPFHGNSIIEHLSTFRLDESNQLLSFNKTEKFLFKKLLESISSNSYNVDFQISDIQSFELDSTNNLAATFIVVFQALEDRNMVFEKYSTSSSLNLFSRFTHRSKELDELAAEISAYEDKYYKNFLVAELAHLPNQRAGNIIKRTNHRQYELSIFSRNSKHGNGCLYIKDITLRMSNGKFYLRSKKHNKDIIIKNSSAQNFYLNSLPLYQFLCELQHQQAKKGVSFSWGGISPMMTFLPRVTFEGVIVSAATWQFKKIEYSTIIKVDNIDSQVRLLLAFLEKWRIPRYFSIVHGDNYLLIDSKSNNSLRLFLNEIKKKDGIVLKEFLGSTSSVRDGEGKRYINQIMAVLKNEHQTSLVPEYSQTTKTNINEFDVGSSCIYFKIYTTQKPSEKIIIALTELAIELKAHDHITKFFFIRYNDNDGYHVRARFFCKDISAYQQVFGAAIKVLEPFKNMGLVDNILVDSYRREIERYGRKTISYVENLFMADSIWVSQIMKFNDLDEESKWKYSLMSTLAYLDSFNLNNNQQMQIVESMKANYSNEFKLEKGGKRVIDDFYRSSYSTIIEIVNIKAFTDHQVQSLFLDFKNNINEITPHILSIVNENREIDLFRIISGCIHMHFIRLYKSSARLNEYFVYSLLSKAFKTKRYLNQIQ